MPLTAIWCETLTLPQTITAETLRHPHTPPLNIMPNYLRRTEHGDIFAKVYPPVLMGVLTCWPVTCWPLTCWPLTCWPLTCCHERIALDDLGSAVSPSRLWDRFRWWFRLCRSLSSQTFAIACKYILVLLINIF